MPWVLQLSTCYAQAYTCFLVHCAGGTDNLPADVEQSW